MQLRLGVHYDVWKIFPYFQANPYWLKTKNINSISFISIIILLLNNCFVVVVVVVVVVVAFFWGFF